MTKKSKWRMVVDVLCVGMVGIRDHERNGCESSSEMVDVKRWCYVNCSVL